MTSRRFRLANVSLWASITAVLVVLMPSTVFATHFELSRLANEIEWISGQLADDLRYTRHYGSVRQRAASLRRDASQLADSLRRNRSDSRIRSQFKDVRRGYERLEQAFFTADRRDHVPRLHREISLLSNVFTNLSDEFYYAGLGGQNYGPVYNSLYIGIPILSSRNSGLRYSRSPHSGSRHSGSRHSDSRQDSSRDYNSGDYGSRSSGRIAPNRERAVPPVFRGNNGSAVPSRQGGRVGQGERGVRDRPGRVEFSRGSRSVQSAPSSDHKSNVLERQGRQNAQRRELENQARHNRSSGRESSRAANVQRGRSGGDSGNRRRN